MNELMKRREGRMDHRSSTAAAAVVAAAADHGVERGFMNQNEFVFLLLRVTHRK